MAKKASSPPLTGAAGLFTKSYGLVRKNLNVYGLVYAIPAAMIIAGVIQLIVDNQRNGWEWRHAFSSSLLGPNLGSDSSVQTASIIITMVLLLGSTISYLLATVLNLRAAQGKKPTLGSIWNEIIEGWLWAKLLGLGLISIMLLVVGFLLLIIPGVIMMWRLFLAPYILVDQRTTIDEALSKSWKMSSGYAWPIYSIILFSILLSITNVVPIIGGLIAFALTTAYAAAPALRYQEIKNLKVTNK